MAKYAVKIEIESNDCSTVQQLGNLLQHAVNVTKQDDLIKLLQKVKANPGLVSKALKWI